MTSVPQGDRLPDSGWAPLRRVNLSDEIADRLISSILAGKFRFGEKLPPERDLAKYLDVGRPAVREAIRTLRVIGLVEVRPGEGTFIVDQHSDFVARAFGWAILLDARTTREIVEARAAIESELARLAAQRATAADLARLHELLETMERNEGNSEAFSTSDVAFHLVLAGAARNLALERLLQAIQSLLRQWIEQALTQPHTSETAQHQHRAIVEAIESGDPAAASEAMREHIESMGKLIADRIPVRRGRRIRRLT